MRAQVEKKMAQKEKEKKEEKLRELAQMARDRRAGIKSHGDKGESWRWGLFLSVSVCVAVGECSSLLSVLCQFQIGSASGISDDNIFHPASVDRTSKLWNDVSASRLIIYIYFE